MVKFIYIQLMNQNIRIIFLVILLAIYSTSNLTSQNKLPDVTDGIFLHIPVKSNKIAIEDLRTEVSEGEDIDLLSTSVYTKSRSKFYPTVNLDHQNLVKSTINNNTNSQSLDIADFIITINEACKEIETKGKSEIERIYMNLEVTMTIKGVEIRGIALDTFYYESKKVSTSHFESLYRSSLQNSIYNCLTKIRFEYFDLVSSENSGLKSENEQIISIGGNHKIKIFGSKSFKSATIEDLNFDFSEKYILKLFSNSSGNVTYCELIGGVKTNLIEAKKLLKYVKNLKIVEQGDYLREYRRIGVIE